MVGSSRTAKWLRLYSLVQSKSVRYPLRRLQLGLVIAIPVRAELV